MVYPTQRMMKVNGVLCEEQPRVVLTCLDGHVSQWQAGILVGSEITRSGKQECWPHQLFPVSTYDLDVVIVNYPTFLSESFPR